MAAVCNAKERKNTDYSLTERFNTGSAFKESVITIAPNPVSNIFRINIDDLTAKEIIIKNVMGNTVMRTPFLNNGQQISLSKIPSGTYLLQALNAEKQVVGKTTLFKE